MRMPESVEATALGNDMVRSRCTDKQRAGRSPCPMVSGQYHFTAQTLPFGLDQLALFRYADIACQQRAVIQPLDLQHAALGIA